MPVISAEQLQATAAPVPPWVRSVHASLRYPVRRLDGMWERRPMSPHGLHSSNRRGDSSRGETEHVPAATLGCTTSMGVALGLPLDSRAMSGHDPRLPISRHDRLHPDRHTNLSSSQCG